MIKNSVLVDCEMKTAADLRMAICTKDKKVLIEIDSHGHPIVNVIIFSPNTLRELSAFLLDCAKEIEQGL